MKQPLNTLLSDAEVAAIRRPIESARTFPRHAFTSPAFYAYEVEHVLRSSWMAVVFSAEIGAPGDVLPTEMLDEPILLVRNTAGEARAFHNVCPYDGCEVAVGPATGLTVLITPYHGWQYSLDGELREAGYWDGTPATQSLDVTALGADLVAVDCAEWFGVIFVRLASHGATFDEHMAPVFAHVAETELERLAIGRLEDGNPAIDALPIRANWKTVYENYSPNVYHESFVHAMYRNSPHSPRVDDSGDKTYDEIIDQSGFIGLQYDNDIGGSFYPDSPFSPLLDRSGQPSRRNTIANGFPNWAITLLNHYARMTIWLPQGPEFCAQKIATFYHRGQAADPQLLRQRARAARGGVIAREEDNRICESIQRARRSRAVAGQFYSPFWDRPHYTLTNILLDKLEAAPGNER